MSVPSSSNNTHHNSPTCLFPFNEASLSSNFKSSVTIVIQPPSSQENQFNSLLTKRRSPQEFADILLKKIKNQASSAEDVSSQKSLYSLENIEGYSDKALKNSKTFNNVEESPISEETIPLVANQGSEIPSYQRIWKRSLQTKEKVPSSLSYSLGMKQTFGLKESQKKVQQALETLQKKLLLHQQLTALKEAFLKECTPQESLYIPPLMSPTRSSETSAGNRNEREIKSLFNSGEDKPKVIYGPVEYPFLSMTNPLSNNQNTNKMSLSSLPSSLLLLNSTKLQTSPCKGEGSLLESLCATRAETQRSESDEVNEGSPQAVEEKKKRGRKVKDIEGKAPKREKKQGREKGKSKQQKASLSFQKAVKVNGFDV